MKSPQLLLLPQNTAAAQTREYYVAALMLVETRLVRLECEQSPLVVGAMMGQAHGPRVGHELGVAPDCRRAVVLNEMRHWTHAGCAGAVKCG